MRAEPEQLPGTEEREFLWRERIKAVGVSSSSRGQS